ncbi:pyridoxamine 5-phosphate oxidase-domain-containing protein [Gigaspora margarita]|uniref:Pyridoxamine 5-phosphate oxidase-domain-containing protein n=3 Tax=Gigaspora margarita TaxID=4874 RepID=A0A8H4EQ44_GIGMA|nr:pyridoxamine 5-phosphate oxidase-domain-containing protein [Gigaspora margarita]
MLSLQIKCYIFFLTLILYNADINVCNAHEKQTEQEAAIVARSLVFETGTGTLVTVMKTKEELQGYPFGLFDYFSDDCPPTGNPLMLLTDYQLNVKNARENDFKVSLMIQKFSKNETYFPMAEPRLNLFGKLVKIENDEILAVQECFLKKHPRARDWIPGRGHDFNFYRLKVVDIYFVGGFGDKRYIGYIDLTYYKSAQVGLPRLYMQNF